MSAIPMGLGQHFNKSSESSSVSEVSLVEYSNIISTVLCFSVLVDHHPKHLDQWSSTFLML